MPNGLTLSASCGGGDREVRFQVTDSVEERHYPEAKGLHVARDVEGDHHGGLFPVLSGGGSGELAWDQGKGGKAEVGELNFFSHLVTGDVVVALKGEDVVK